MGSWAGHGVQFEEGLSTMRDLIRANRYRVATLPHTGLMMGRGEAYWNIAPGFVDTCRLPHLDPAVSDPSKVDPMWWKGLGNATVMNGQQFESKLLCVVVICRPIRVSCERDKVCARAHGRAGAAGDPPAPTSQR